jgi:hypothetical protein
LVKPYQDEVLGNVKIRTFSSDTQDAELVWHRDHNDRIVEVLEGCGWSIQFDNMLPERIDVGKRFEVKAYEYHRLHKGSGNLKLKITEMV